MVSAALLNGQKQIVLQSREGYFLKFDVEEIPEKKKNALGVRGMKLGEKDKIEHVFYTCSGTDSFTAYKDKPLDLGKLKTAKRDGKGTKIRV